jgi:hypothetical protein
MGMTDVGAELPLLSTIKALFRHFYSTQVGVSSFQINSFSIKRTKMQVFSIFSFPFILLT